MALEAAAAAKPIFQNKWVFKQSFLFLGNKWQLFICSSTAIWAGPSKDTIVSPSSRGSVVVRDLFGLDTCKDYSTTIPSRALTGIKGFFYASTDQLQEQLFPLRVDNTNASMSKYQSLA
ncbi:hypothetical protein I7I51_01160 [Histoplasma capsulatum]|uniref:Uncharacterized protein n=1 Tax=Ajellomyces capsulatus TaxID=5037 RepID=A0A8A1MBZ0_AJECA|nr:hypothetical protein I7I51_01160 [Histoplasma capsulatum]